MIGPAGDPRVQVVLDALAFATAAVDGDTDLAMAVAEDGLATDRDGFLEALATTVDALAEEAEDAGGDVRRCLRELGIHLAALADRRGEVDLRPEHRERSDRRSTRTRTDDVRPDPDVTDEE